jgi:hypothetical protein
MARGAKTRRTAIVGPRVVTLQYAMPATHLGAMGDIVAECVLLRVAGIDPTVAQDLAALRRENGDLSRQVIAMRELLHHTITEMVVGRSGGSPKDVVMMHEMGVSLDRLPIRYRFDTLLIAAAAHDVEACDALMDVSDDVFQYPTISFVYATCQLLRGMKWDQCNCADAPDRYSALLNMARRMVAANPLLPTDREDLAHSLRVVNHFVSAPAVCDDVQQHTKILGRVLEIGALLRGLVKDRRP